MSVVEYAAKGSVWKIAAVVGLASVALVVGVRVFGPVSQVEKVDATAPTSAPSPEEEREASAIQELALGGRTAEAKARAQRFLDRYPHSSLADRVRLNAKP